MLRVIFWTLFSVLATMLAVVALWIAIPSDRIITPISWEYDRATGMVDFQRVVNWPGSVKAHWAHDMYVGNESECNDSGVTMYEPMMPIEEGEENEARKPKTRARFPMPLRLKPCADIDGSISILSWSVLVFGVIPMRPVYLSVPPDAQERMSR